MRILRMSSATCFQHVAAMGLKPRPLITRWPARRSLGEVWKRVPLPTAAPQPSPRRGRQILARGVSPGKTEPKNPKPRKGRQKNSVLRTVPGLSAGAPGQAGWKPSPRKEARRTDQPPAGGAGHCPKPNSPTIPNGCARKFPTEYSPQAESRSVL